MRMTKRDIRTMWQVTYVTASGAKAAGIYRSRHANAAGVRTEFSKSGQKIVSIKKA
jgi:hypothetical protein